MTNILDMRNSESARKLVIEAVVCICQSPQQVLSSFPRVDNACFSPNRIQQACLATGVHYSQRFLDSQDPDNLQIPINEIAWSLRKETSRGDHALFWINWLFAYEADLKKQKVPLLCHLRSIPNLDAKMRTDFVWILWDIFRYECSNRGLQRQELMDKLWNFYIFQWEPSKKLNRKPYLMVAVMALTDNISFETPILQNKPELIDWLQKSNQFAFQMKDYEINTS